MQLKNYYYYFIKAIPPKTCEKILEAGRKKIIEQATTGVVGPKINPPKRSCKVAWINDEWIYDIINPFIHSANKKADWNFQWDWNETSQFTIYEKGHYYGWHVDQSTESLIHDNKNIKGKIRKLSLTLQLTDKTKYEGGDFQFVWLNSNKKSLLDIRTVDKAKDIGTIIIFPSFVQHQILPVTKGKREVLVNWSLGKRFK